MYSTQGHNFALKSGGVPIQKQNEAPVGSRRKGRRMGKKHPFSLDSGVCESVVNFLSGVRGGASAENGFIQGRRYGFEDRGTNS